MSLRILAASAALALALAASPASAQEEEDQKDEKPTTIEQLTALAEALEGVRDEKSDTVADNAGEIEAAIMSAAALRKAAASICSITPPATITRVYFVTDADLEQARRAGILLAQMKSMTSFLNSYRGGGGGTGGGDPTKGSRGFIPAVGAVTQLLSVLLRNDDSISAISGTLADANNLASMMLGYRKSGKGCFDGVPINFAQDQVGNKTRADEVVTTINDLNSAYQSFLNNMSAKPTDSEKQIKAGYESFITALATPQNGTTAIEALIRAGDLWDTLGSNGSTALLRLSIDKSGGTLLKRKNLWTALGARSLAVTAGIVVSYRISEANGKTLAGGTIYCTTTQSNFAALHEMGSAGIPANCSSLNFNEDDPVPEPRRRPTPGRR